MSQRERQERTAVAYEMTKAALNAYGIRPTLPLQDAVVKALHDNGAIFRGEESVRRTLTNVCETLKSRDRDFGRDPGTPARKNVADELSSRGSLDWGDRPDPNRERAIAELSQALSVRVTDVRPDLFRLSPNSVPQPTATGFSSNPISGSPTARPKTWNPISGLDLANKRHLDMLVVDEIPDETLVKAARRLSEAKHPFPADLAARAPRARGGK